MWTSLVPAKVTCLKSGKCIHSRFQVRFEEAYDFTKILIFFYIVFPFVLLIVPIPTLIALVFVPKLQMANG